VAYPAPRTRVVKAADVARDWPASRRVDAAARRAVIDRRFEQITRMLAEPIPSAQPQERTVS
jgi:hypothetical protein